MKVRIGKYPNHYFWHNWLYKLFGYSPTQKTKIRIDSYDTWSMDHTLAPIILPMLKQLKETKHGAPAVEFKDVPEELMPPDAEAVKKLYMENGETDENFFKRWDYVLDEMIWAFEQKCRDDWESDYYEHHVLSPDEKNYDGFFGGSKLVCKDPKGLKAHQARMSNGFRLFGKYYENLWD